MRLKLLLLFIGINYLAMAQTDTFDTPLYKPSPLNQPLVMYMPAPLQPYKNVIGVTASTFLVYINGSVNYERMIWHKPTSYIQSVWARATVGGYWVLDVVGFEMDLEAFTLLGRKNHHIEIGAGVTAIRPQNGEFSFLPMGDIGYRYQKLLGRFMFRSGLSFPKGVYIGVGYAF